jgi:glyoxylase-like metal-dependent hydrolase (beta-lactamase superfamily II)
MPVSRRDFLARSAGLALASAFSPRLLRTVWSQVPQDKVVASEPFADLLQVADGIYAVISKPFGGDRTTLANGGLIVGKKAVLAIEGFYTPQGATWLAGKAKELTGRWPTHVVVTHYHADHANGVAGYLTSTDHPELRSTDITRSLVLERNKPEDAARTSALQAEVILSATEPSEIDLGGRTVHIAPTLGHTDSDLTLEVMDPHVLFCGDLFWNHLFPNYVDAIPTKLKVAGRALRRSNETVFVPGHGARATAADLESYLSMIDEVEHAAREAHGAGKTAADGAATFTVPASLGTWTGNKAFFERAFSAWYKDLEKDVK